MKPFSLGTSCLVLLGASLALAQTTPSRDPYGGPATPPPPAAAQPAAPPQASPNSRLAPPAPPPAVPAAPPGMQHPSFGPGQAPAAMPHRGEPPRDVSEASHDVPKGTVAVTVVDENEQPLAGKNVDLLITFESVAEGQREDRRRAVSDASGRATFGGLSSELSFSYVVVAERDGGHYGVAPFRLKPEVGQRVRLHAYPTTSDPKRTFMGMRGFVFVQPREETFQVEALFRVINMGTVSWLPKDVVLSLPKGFTAFDGPGEEGDMRFVEEPGRGARLEGTFSPGQHDVRFTYQIPSSGNPSQSFDMSLPPHVAELRVLAEAAPGMSLDVDGFEPAEPARGPTGDRVLITGRMMRPGQGELTSIHVRLAGIPVQGPLRWAVAAAAALIALGGLAWAVLHRGKARGRHAVAGEDLDHARRLLLDELVAVERAHEAGSIGPRTHEQARRQLLDALARLDFAPRLEEPRGDSAAAR